MKQHLSHNAFVQRHAPFCLRRVAPAFTLIEMLVVITIITVLLTVGAMGLKNMAKSSGVSAGIPIAEAVFSEARAIAIGKGTNARVLIHAQNDHSNEYHRERLLRYMAIAYQNLDDQGEPIANEWVIASKGVTLPKGVYFLKDLSNAGGQILETESNVSLPGGVDAAGDCYYYEFNAEGMISSPVPDENNVPRFVIGSGSLPPSSIEPKIKGKNIGGFVIWRTGRTSLFRHPDQIDSSL